MTRRISPRNDTAVEPEQSDEPTQADESRLFANAGASNASVAQRARRARARKGESAGQHAPQSMKARIARQKRVQRRFQHEHGQMRIRVPYWQIDSQGYAAFVAEAARWMSHRVMSRTKIDGKPVRRELKMLAPGSPSETWLRQVWGQVRDMQGQTVTLNVVWHWPTPWRPESASFYLVQKDIKMEPKDVRSSRPDGHKRVAAMKLNTPRKIAAHARTWVRQAAPHRVQRLSALLSVVEAGGDDRYMSHSSVKDYLSETRPLADYWQHIGKELVDADFVRALEKLDLDDKDPVGHGLNAAQKTVYKAVIRAKLHEIDEAVYRGRDLLQNRQSQMGKAYNAGRGDKLLEWMRARQKDGIYKHYPL
jgi:hypothetical protein